MFLILETGGISISFHAVTLTAGGVIHIKIHLHFDRVKGRAARFH